MKGLFFSHKTNDWKGGTNVKKHKRDYDCSG